MTEHATPEPAYRQQLRELTATVRGQREQIAAACGALTLTLEGVTIAATVAAGALAEVPQIEGLTWSLLPAAPPAGSYSHLVVGGEMGAQSPRVRVAHSVTINVLRGAILWWQESAGPDPVRAQAGDVLSLAAGELHGFVVLEQYLSYNVFSPALG